MKVNDILDLEFKKDIDEYNNLSKLDNEKKVDEFLFCIYMAKYPDIVLSIINNLLYKGHKYSKRGIMYEPGLEFEIHKNFVNKSFNQLCYEFVEYKLSKKSEELLSIIGKELRKNYKKKIKTHLTTENKTNTESEKS